MPPTHTNARARAATLAVASLVATGCIISLPATTGSALAATGSAMVTSSADAYVDEAFPARTTGSSTKLVAGIGSPDTKTSYLRFAVPVLPDAAALSSARVTVSLDRASSGSLRLHSTGSDWSESTISARNAPPVGTVVAEGAISGDSAVFDISEALVPGTTVSYAITNATGVAALASRERAATAPRLELSWSTGATTSPSTTAPPTTAPPTVQPVAAGTVRIGMSAPMDQWDARLRETGPVRSRRLFAQLSSPSGMISHARSEIAAGRMPIMSFKLPNNDWVGAAAGKYDAQLRNLASRLDDLPGQVFVTIHHEPNNDGPAKDYAAMQRHVLPILSPPSNVDAGVIVNGFWWSEAAAGMTDAEIAQWLPADVLRLAEVVAADTYQGGTVASPGEHAGPKIRGLSAWATRVGVTRLGIGEYNGLTAAAIKAAGDAVLADPRFVFATAFNSSENNRAGVDWLLTGDRLTAFKNTLAAAR